MLQLVIDSFAIIDYEIIEEIVATCQANDDGCSILVMAMKRWVTNQLLGSMVGIKGSMFSQTP